MKLSLRKARKLNQNQKDKVKARDIENIVYPRKISLPEPFYSAIIDYFKKDNVKQLDVSKIKDLKRDLINIALNLNDGNISRAARMLNLSTWTVSQINAKLNI